MLERCNSKSIEFTDLFMGLKLIIYYNEWQAIMDPYFQFSNPNPIDGQTATDVICNPKVNANGQIRMVIRTEMLSISYIVACEMLIARMGTEEHFGNERWGLFLGL